MPKKHLDNAAEKRDNHEDNAQRCELMICAEENVSQTQDVYILALCGCRSEPDLRIAAAFSNYSCAVYSIGETLSKTILLPYNDSPVVGIKFSPSSKHILYTATRNGTISACDLRAKGKIVSTIRDSSPDGKLRRLASFEVSSDDRLVVAGSEHVGGDAFILFWDLRYNSGRTEGSNRLLGGYWESHMDDITALAFHPSQIDVLASGSTDGLINVFDLTRHNEDSALKYSLNTESSVESNVDTSYVVKMHNSNAFGQPFLIGGSTSGNGKLSGLSFADGYLERCYDFIGNRQLVRDSWYDEKSDRLITGGEMGIINVWKQSDSIRDLAVAAATKPLAKFDGKVRDRQPRAKPY